MKYPSLRSVADLIPWATLLVRKLNEESLLPTGTVTLRANETTTDIANMALRITSKVILTPTTAGAAAELASGNLYVSAKATGKATITHTNDPSTTRTFDYVVI